MGKKKIINDPIYGLTSFPYDILYTIIDHPYFQRLRRISQMGLSQYVYPGATHTRFHHALGALHLMTQAIETLRWKGVTISNEEAEAASIAILLHDIGHGPFSHALEGLFLPRHHEQISLGFIRMLNKEHGGKLDLAIQIFTNAYHRPFLHQLISGQLDMDRMDYLIRDSYFTGVAEGVIGYDRIIRMLNVVDDHLVVEEKGIYSIEKFLIARRIMYMQVYLHKTSIVAEQMLKAFIRNYLKDTNHNHTLSFPLNLNEHKPLDSETLHWYASIDDTDVFIALKESRNSQNELLAELSNRLLDRDLLKVEIHNSPISEKLVIQKIKDLNLSGMDEHTAKKLVISGRESNLGYNMEATQIQILLKNQTIVPFSQFSDFSELSEAKDIYFLMYPIH